MPPLNLNLNILANGPVGIDKVAKALRAAFDKTSPTDTISKNINNVTKAVKAAGGEVTGFSASARVFNDKMSISSKTTAQLSTVMQDLGRQTAITTKRYAGFIVASRLTLGLSRALSDATSETIKFQREISKVAQLRSIPIFETAGLEENISRLATRFGVDANELVKSSQTLAQAGKNLGEINRFLTAVAPATLTATFEDAAKSTESLLAITTQFKIEAGQTGQVLDIFNSVAKEFNVSVNELFEGLRRSGSAFAAFSNVENSQQGIQALKEFTALFTSVIATSRESASVIGTAFRTILPRLQRTETVKFLRAMNIELLDSNGKFIGVFNAVRTLTDALRDIPTNDPRFSRIAEQLGGLRQINRLIPLIKEFAKAEDALAIANKSQGSVAQDAAIAQQTLQVQFQKTQENLNALFRELANNENVKELISLFLQGANSAIEFARAIQDLIPLIGALTAARVAISIPSAVGSFRRNFFNPRPLAKGGLVPTLLTPGERVFLPSAVGREGTSKLRRLNSTGDPTGIRSFSGSFVVPGQGNQDSVPVSLPTGSFVIKKKNALRGFARGGYLGMADGGMTLPRNFNRAGTQIRDELQGYARELQAAGKSVKQIKEYFASTASSSKNLAETMYKLRTVRSLTRFSNLEIELEEGLTADKQKQRAELDRRRLERDRIQQYRASNVELDVERTARGRVLSRLKGRAVSPAAMARLVQAETTNVYGREMPVGSATYSSVSRQRVDSILRQRASRFNLRGAFSRMNQFGTAGISEAGQARLGQAGVAAIIAGGLLSSQARTKEGKALGGGLTGAGIGLQAGLMTGNPILAAAGAIGGAAIGVSQALKRLEDDLKKQKLGEIAETLGRRLQDAVPEDRENLAASQTRALARQNMLLREEAISQGSRLGVGQYVAAGISDFVNPNRPGLSADERARRQNIERSAQEQRAADRQAFEFRQNNIRERLRFNSRQLSVGLSVGSNADIVKKLRKDPALLRSFALQNEDLPRYGGLKALEAKGGYERFGGALLDKFLKAANKDAIEFAKHANAVNKSLLIFDNLANSLVVFEAKLSAVDQSLDIGEQRISQFTAAAGGQLSGVNRANLFGNIQAFSGRALRSEALNLTDFIPDINSASTLLDIANTTVAGRNLSENFANILAGVQASQQGFGPNSGIAVRQAVIDSKILEQIPIGIRDAVLSNIEDTFADDNSLQKALENPTQALDKATPIFSQAASVVSKFTDTLNKGNANLLNAINQRVAVESKATDLLIQGQSVGFQSADFRRKTLGGALSQNDALNRLGSRLTLLTGGEFTPEQIGANIRGGRARQVFLQNQLALAPSQRVGQLSDNKLIQELAKNSLTITNNIKALDELKESNVLLTSVQERVAAFREAQQASRGFLEQAAFGAPQELRAMQQQIRDAATLLSGGGANIRGQNAAQAIQIARQIVSTQTDTQLENRGLTRQEAEARIQATVERLGRRNLQGGDAARNLIRNARADLRNPELNRLLSEEERISQLRINAFKEAAALEKETAATLNQAIVSMRKDFVDNLSNVFKSFTEEFKGIPKMLEVTGQVEILMPQAEIFGKMSEEIIKKVSEHIDRVLPRRNNEEVGPR